MYFTNSYPYDMGEEWKTNELTVLKDKFDITVVPFFSHSKKLATKLVKGVKYQEPIFNKLPTTHIKKQLIKIFFSKNLFLFIKEFFKQKVYRSKKNIIQWIIASYRIQYLQKNNQLNTIINKADKNTILYFFWGKETSEIVPVLKTEAKIIIRFHGYDLYENRNYNYIPYRTNQLKKLHTALFISEQGKRYLQERYKKIKFNAKILRLGTISEGLSKMSIDSILRIYSCSSIIPLKRVDLIAKAILSLEIKVEWTHIGDGIMIDKIKSIILNRPSNVKINLVGQVRSSEVKSFYVNKPVDLFINASTTERCTCFYNGSYVGKYSRISYRCWRNKRNRK